MSTEKALEKPTETQQATQAVTPLVDVFENADEILIFADVPGVAKDALVVNLDKQRLTFTGKSARGFEYKRTFVVPAGIDADKINATLDLGVLRVALPKSAALKPRQIAVKAS